MEGNYTTKLRQQKLELSDVYYLSCEASNEGEHKEFSLAGPVTKMVLVASMTVGTGEFTVQAKDLLVTPNEVPTLVQVIGMQNSGQQWLSSVEDGKFSLGVELAPSYQQQSRRIREANIERLERTERLQMLRDSFLKNKTGDPISFASMMTMRYANRSLCSLPFKDSILQYNKYDDVWQYNLYFDKEVEMSVSVYVEDDKIDDVDFSIYHAGELLVANTLPLQQLVKKMKSVIAKIQRNA